MTSTIEPSLAEAKERVRIADLSRDLGFEGEPRKVCRCPFHEDKSPSFSVFDDGRRWKCHAGCGEGTVVDFLMKAKGLSEEEACREILRRAGMSPLREKSEQPTGKARFSAPPELPPLSPCSREIAQRVADSRGLGIAAIEFAAWWFKTVVFGRVCDQDCWILTDASGKCAEARRIDAKPFP